MRYWICARCQTAVPSGLAVCPSCRMVLDMVLCSHDGTPVPVKNQHCPICGSRLSRWSLPWGYWWGLFFLVSLAAMFPLMYLHQSIATTYHQETCVVEHAWITSAKASTYQINVSYRVTDAHGQPLTTWVDTSSGYATQEEAQQALLLQYDVGSIYPCWYSPIASLGSPDVLTTPPSQHDSALLFTWICGITLMLILARWCLLRWIVFSWHLDRRGIKVTGVVVFHELVRNGKFLRTIILFRTQTKPPLEYHLTIHDWPPLRKIAKKDDPLAVRRKVQVLYDPLYPGKNARLLARASHRDRVIAIIVGCGLLLLLIGGGCSLFVLWAFSFG